MPGSAEPCPIGRHGRCHFAAAAASGGVEGDHGGDPPEGRAVDGWPSSLVGSASGRPPRSRALLLLLAGGVVLVVAVVAIVAALTGQSPDKAVSTCTDGPSACVPR